MNPIRLLCLAACSSLALAQAQPREEAFEFGRFGQVHVYAPEGKASSVVLLAAQPWDATAVAAARSLAGGGALVAGVDAGVYLAAANDSGEPCAYPAGELEDLAHSFERRYAVGEYLTPTLAGLGAGAGLWYAALAQAPRGTFHALLTGDFCPQLPLTHPLCPGSGLHSSTSANNTTLQPAADLAVRWSLLESADTRRCTGGDAASFIAANPLAQKIRAPAAAGADWNLQWQAAYRQLTLAAPHPPLPEQVNDLPLVEVPLGAAQGSAARGGAEGPQEQRFAVLFTGDGGWAGIDKEMAARLAASNIPAVGLSTLKYFWQARTPAETSRDLARIVRYYSAQWHRERVLLIGYSFGADVLPEVVNGLPPDVRNRVDSVNLIGLSHNASFEIRVAGWLGAAAEGSPIRPQIDRLGKLPVVCIRGDEEKDSLCPELTGTHVRKVLLAGGHHYNGDYTALVKAILSGGGS